MKEAFQNGVKKYNVYTWDEVKLHNKPDDKWLVIDGKVYDITSWAKKHPGGAKVISHYAGEDATDAWVAFHNDKELVSKFLKTILIGELSDYKPTALQLEFRKLRKTVEDMGWLKTNPWFFVAHFVHLIVMMVIAGSIMRIYGTGWLPYIASAVVFATFQAQAGWTQHDYGHLSVFKTNRMNHVFHYITINILKGASSHWWNFRHNQHHAKPNTIRKDPDIAIGYLFLLGDYMPVSWAKRKKGVMPYNFQHQYFFLLGPPLLLPIYFHLENIYFVIKRKDWLDLGLTLLFFAGISLTYEPLLGHWGAFCFYMFARCLESHWFLWVTQMSHIPNNIDVDKNLEWFQLQLITSCNVDPSLFNDWFTGHLNFQIEHHLFPTMPRHNYYKVKPLVESMAKTYGVSYRSKNLYQAFVDIYRSLKKSGEIWYDVFYA
ncbi:acyl-CoA 6-desaturase-like [Gigantopelta aegis]|uniref:acyl-CoA 6-desaturase-like n=1 Tax=Gigantopelta aegis TaxID=1735272 RepID=UPI001B888C68|nr:acyl-CoA 6-desaturase-like [Gigantopelta aegis]